MPSKYIFPYRLAVFISYYITFGLLCNLFTGKTYLYWPDTAYGGLYIATLIPSLFVIFYLRDRNQHLKETHK